MFYLLSIRGLLCEFMHLYHVCKKRKKERNVRQIREIILVKKRWAWKGQPQGPSRSISACVFGLCVMGWGPGTMESVMFY